MEKTHRVAVIGGGVSGAVAAIELSNLGIKNVLFEKEKSLVNGPPFCHLHAGGNLYPDITDQQCQTLLRQSIEMARLFPESIDERPTLISVQKTEDYSVKKITNRLDMLREHYAFLVEQNPANKVLGSPKDYYRIYNKEELLSLQQRNTVKIPTQPDEWMINAIKLIDIEKLKTPIILVQEYGWNFFRLAAQAQLALEKTDHCTLHLNTEVCEIKDFRNKNTNYNWEVHTKDQVFKVDYLVNSCGYKTGVLDETLQLKSERLIEFKASYVSQWKPLEGLIPELIFHGKRGTENGMAQLTPYCNDYYQIHGMTKDVTLFPDGLMDAKGSTSQPKFNKEITRKLENGWEENEVNSRTKKSIDFIGKFVPSFKDAKVGGPPLFGAQQIAGKDPDLRVGEVKFPSRSYARSEIIKASSAYTVASKIIDKLKEEKIISFNKTHNRTNILEKISTSEIDRLSADFSAMRGYSRDLSKLLVKR